MTDRDGILPHLYLAAHMPYHASLRRFIINLPKTRSIVADAGNPDGDNKLVLLRVQREGASGETRPVTALRPVKLILRMLGTDTRAKCLS